MKIFSQFSAEERAEIDALIHDSYTDEDGNTRTHAEAADEFDRRLTNAIQAHREWAGMLLDTWRYDGMKRFIADRYKHSEIFEFTRKERRVSRTLRRGRRRVDDNGERTWVQDRFLEFTRADLVEAIKQEAQAIAERKTNLEMYRALVALLDETEASTIAEALTIRGQTLDDFLSERLAS